MDNFEIGAELREDVGKGASRRLRNTGKVPGILYGADKGPVNLSVDQNELFRHLENEAFYSHVLELNLAGKLEQVVLKDMQRHPSKAAVLHVDFQRVIADQKLQMSVPLHFMNEETCPGKKAGGMISHLMSEVEIVCLPRDLPEFIEIDMTEMDIGDTMNLSQISLPSGVEITALTHGDDYDQAVVSIYQPKGDTEDDIEAEGEEAPAPAEAESED